MLNATQSPPDSHPKVNRSSARTASPFAISARELTKTYPGGVRALQGLSFSVEAGTVFGLLGPNGAGKSTTVKVLTTLSRADAGEARVAGLEVRQQAEQVRRAIGIVAQKSGLDPELTGRENLILQGQIHGMKGPGLRRRAAELLERFGLEKASDRVARTYSGGMKRKLDIAVGLVHHPQVLFLDEPTTGLDPEARADLWAEIRRLSQQEGLTILLTTHYLEEADKLAQNLAIVDHGRVVAAGTPEELKRELRGDAILIELAEASDGASALETLGNVAGVREPALEGRTLRARVDSGATALPAVLAALESAGLRVAAVTVARPSLDDVYLRYAGRAYNESENL